MATKTATSGLALNPLNGLEQVKFLGAKMRADYRLACTSATVSLTTDMVSQFDFTFADPGMQIMRGGLLKPDIPVDLGGFRMRIASISTSEVGAGIEGVSITARPEIVRKLKRRRGALVMKNATPSEFVRRECKAVGAKYKIQPSPKRKRISRDTKRGTSAVITDDTAPSSWTTFQRLAQELGYACFESGGKIFFGQPTWLVQQYVDSAVKVGWKVGPTQNRLEKVPECSQSLDSPDGKQISVQIPIERWREVRPGKVLSLSGVPHFTGNYLITSVDFDLTGRDKFINVQAGTPINPTPAGWGNNVGSQGAAGYSGGRSLRSLLRWAGFTGKNLDIAIGVVMAESGGDAKALGDTTIQTAKWGPSVGLFQIRSLKNPSKYTGLDAKRKRGRLEDAMYNARLAYQIFKAEGWSPWSTYKSNSYKRFTKKDYSIKHWKPPAPSTTYGYAQGNKSAGLFVEHALRQAGDRYVFGAEASKSDPDPSVFDCSELIEWAAAQAGGYMPDGSGNQMAYMRSKGTTMSVSQAINTRGAILWKPGHVAISLGNGKTIEAANRSYGVTSMSATNRSFRWQGAGRVPGLRY